MYIYIQIPLITPRLYEIQYEQFYYIIPLIQHNEAMMVSYAGDTALLEKYEMGDDIQMASVQEGGSLDLQPDFFCSHIT